MGNLNSESVSDPDPDLGESPVTPRLGVLGTVEAPEERPEDALLLGG